MRPKTWKSSYAVINTASKQYCDVRRESETRNNNVLQWNKKYLWMSWINWFVHTVVNVRHQDGLSCYFWTCWTLLQTKHWFCGLPLIQTGSKASHTAGDCFCASWLHNYSMITRLHISGHRMWNVGVYRNAHADQEWSLQRLACPHRWWCDWPQVRNAKKRRRWCRCCCVDDCWSISPTAVLQKERAEDDNRMQHMSNAVLQAAQLCDDCVSRPRYRSRVWLLPRQRGLQLRFDVKYCH